jgi:hypothetical protein
VKLCPATSGNQFCSLAEGHPESAPHAFVSKENRDRLQLELSLAELDVAARLERVRALMRLMREEGALQLKVDGVEITLDPRPFVGDVAPIEEPRRDPEPKDLAVDDTAVNPLRQRLRELTLSEQLNGQDVDEETEFAHVDGAENPFATGRR